jgi:hypothetical protein
LKGNAMAISRENLETTPVETPKASTSTAKLGDIKMDVLPTTARGARGKAKKPKPNGNGNGSVKTTVVSNFENTESASSSFPGIYVPDLSAIEALMKPVDETEKKKIEAIIAEIRKNIPAFVSAARKLDTRIEELTPDQKLTKPSLDKAREEIAKANKSYVTHDDAQVREVASLVYSRAQAETCPATKSAIEDTMAAIVRAGVLRQATAEDQAIVDSGKSKPGTWWVKIFWTTYVVVERFRNHQDTQATLDALQRVVRAAQAAKRASDKSELASLREGADGTTADLLAGKVRAEGVLRIPDRKVGDIVRHGGYIRWSIDADHYVDIRGVTGAPGFVKNVKTMMEDNTYISAQDVANDKFVPPPSSNGGNWWPPEKFNLMVGLHSILRRGVETTKADEESAEKVNSERAEFATKADLTIDEFLEGKPGSAILDYSGTFRIKGTDRHANNPYCLITRHEDGSISATCPKRFASFFEVRGSLDKQQPGDNFRNLHDPLKGMLRVKANQLKG